MFEKMDESPPTNATPPKKRGRPRNDWKPRFLAAIAKCASPTKAAKAANIGRQHAYYTKDRDPDFAKAWEEAEQQGVDMLEDELRRRGLKTSDACLIFALKAHRPEKYADRVIHGGMGPQGEIKIRVSYEDQNANSPTAAPAPEPTTGDQ